MTDPQITQTRLPLQARPPAKQCEAAWGTSGQVTAEQKMKDERTYPFPLKAVLGKTPFTFYPFQLKALLGKKLFTFYPFQPKAVLGKFLLKSSPIFTHFSPRHF